MKEESKNKKTNTSVTKRVFSIVVAVVIFMFIVNVNVFAVLISGSFDNQPLPIFIPNNASELKSSGYLIQSKGSYTRYASSQYGDVYCVMYQDNSDRNYLIYGSLVSTTVYNTFAFVEDADGNGLGTNNLSNIYSSEYGDIYISGNILYGTTSNDWNINCPLYDTRDEALNALSNILINGSDDIGQQLSINLPSGNIAIIEIAGGSNQVSISVPIGTGGNQTSPQTNINDIKIGSFSTKPSSVSSTMSGIEYPVWTGTGNPNIFGKYFSWKTSFDNAISGDKYLVVSNPLQINTNIYDNAWSLTCTINVQNATNYWIVPTQTQYDGTTQSWEGIDSGEEYTGTYDENNNEWSLVDGEGNPVTPNAGGNTTVNNFTGSVNDWLKHIAEEISSFFNGPINAIQTVAGAISQFSGTLKALYVWLPGPVQSLLTSAIMLAITIGVIKVFI